MRTRFYLSLYLLIAGIYLLSASGRIGRMSDSTAMFHVAESMINHGSLSSEPCDPRYDDAAIGPLCVPGRDGRFYAAYGLVPSLLVVPAILFGKLVSTVLHLDPQLIVKASVSFFTLLIAPLNCVILAMWIVQLGYSRRTAVFGACLLAFGSPFWQNSVSGFLSEPYFTLGLVLAAYLLSDHRVRYASVLSGFAFGLACGARVAGVIMFPIFILALALQVRIRRLPRAQFFRDTLLFTAPFAACMALMAWTNYSRFGSVFKTGYHIAFPTMSFTFSNPLFQGLRELLFHGEVGLLIFAPWVVLVLLCFPEFMRSHLPEAIVCGSMFVLNLLFYAKYQQWHGGWAGGPRYLLPALPFLIIVIVPTIGVIQKRISRKNPVWVLLRSSVVLLLASGFLIQAITVVYPRDRYYALFMFYKDRQHKPWWYGCIPFAALDYWSQTSIPKTEARTPVAKEKIPLSLAVSDSQRTDSLQWPYGFADAVATENDFINMFQHPENLELPELMVLKSHLMGLPERAIRAYVIAVFMMILIGGLGLMREMESPPLQSSAGIGNAISARSATAVPGRS